MLSNLRQGLSVDTYVKIFGLVKDPSMDSFFEFTKVNSDDLIGEYDFEIYDGTLPSEKVYMAQTLEEMLGYIIPNPQLAMLLGIDPKAVFNEVLVLRGIRHPERFSIAESQRKMVLEQMVQQYANANASPNGQDGGQGVQSGVGMAGGQPSPG
jgi:hypothetical protein